MDDGVQQPAASAAADETGAGPDDSHRGFVREMNNAFSAVYAVGGISVVALTVAVGVVAAQLGALASPLTWIAAVGVFLVGLFVLRVIVRRRALRLRERIRAYCQANDVPVDELRQHYDDGEAYPYFASIFEVIERREQLRNQ